MVFSTPNTEGVQTEMDTEMDTEDTQSVITCPNSKLMNIYRESEEPLLSQSRWYHTALLYFKYP